MKALNNHYLFLSQIKIPWSHLPVGFLLQTKYKVADKTFPEGIQGQYPCKNSSESDALRSVWPCSHYTKLYLFCKNICQHEAISSANDFFHPQKFFTIATKLQRCRHGLALEATNFLSSEKILCSLTSILHRVIIFRNELHAAYVTVLFYHNLSQHHQDQFHSVRFDISDMRKLSHA